MKTIIELNDYKYEIDILNGIDISIAVDFKNNNNPTFYDIDHPSVNYYKNSNNEYNLDKNGRCNVPIISLNIHCSTTHTECAKHITNNSLDVNSLIIPYFIPSQVISVMPEKYTTESYHVNYEDKDMYITKKSLLKVIDSKCESFNQGLIIRTLPNLKSKKNQNYDKIHHPFLTNDAIKFIKNAGFKHIVVDMPSIDKYDDNGKLGNHHIFFINKDGKVNKNTLTEFAFIPDKVIDGKYFLNLNISNFTLDSAPSRPLLYSYKKL